VAESHVAATDPADVPPTAASAYRAVLASRMRSQRSYRTSFVLDVVSSAVVGLLELAEVWVLFHNVPVIGGLAFPAILLVFGITEIGFSLAQLVAGHVDRMPTFLRAGTLDVLYLRPQPVLLQVVTSDFQLRRLSRAAVGIGALVVALRTTDIDWSPAKVALLALTLPCAFVTHTAMVVAAGGAQFFLLGGAEATNAAVYGGRYAATQPASIWPSPLVVVFGFLFPMAMTGYVPALNLLDLPGPALLPTWLAWCTPVFALSTCGIAALAWRLGIRHYQGGGG
jgi:ABC-2 type transport system permease protein